jgi:hypothetical protein
MRENPPKAANATSQKPKKGTDMDMVKKTVSQLTDIGLSLLALAIVASLLVGSANMSFLGDVAGNIVALVKDLGSAGLAGLLSLGIVVLLVQKR